MFEGSDTWTIEEGLRRFQEYALRPGPLSALPYSPSRRLMDWVDYAHRMRVYASTVTNRSQDHAEAKEMRNLR